MRARNTAPHRGAVNLGGLPIIRLRENMQHAKSIAWLSLDHLQLPSDKLLNQQIREQLMFKSSVPGRLQ
jgi:hypothetical protein